LKAVLVAKGRPLLVEFIGTAYNAFPQFSEAFAIAGEAFAVAGTAGGILRDVARRFAWSWRRIILASILSKLKKSRWRCLERSHANL
jgi:hypothetical protein